MNRLTPEERETALEMAQRLDSPDTWRPARLLARALLDAEERLDWLEENAPGIVTYTDSVVICDVVTGEEWAEAPTLREAIDTARGAA